MHKIKVCMLFNNYVVFFSSRRRHTRCALVTGVQTCALPIFRPSGTAYPIAFLLHQQTLRFGCVTEAVGRQADGLCVYRLHQIRCDHDHQLALISLELRSEEHTSELQSLMRTSYAVFCLKKKIKNMNTIRSAIITNTTHIYIYLHHKLST